MFKRTSNVVYLPKHDLHEACLELEKVIQGLATTEGIDLSTLDENFDLLGKRRYRIYARYVRARGYRFEDCKNMLWMSIKWRLSVKPFLITIDEILDVVKRDYVFFHEFDKEGNPISWVNVQYHVDYADKLHLYQKFVLFMMEEGIRRANRTLDVIESSSSTSPDDATTKTLPNIRATLVFNMFNFGMANMDFSIVKYLAETLQAHYPEVLAHTYVLDAPWIFTTSWSMIKGWLDPVVVSKIKFVNREELYKFIDRERADVSVGGTAQHRKMWEEEKKEKQEEQQQREKEKEKEEKKGKQEEEEQREREKENEKEKKRTENKVERANEQAETTTTTTKTVI